MAADPAIGRADTGVRAAPATAAQAAQLMFEHHGSRVLAYCQRRLKSREEAEDALQTTFLYAYRGLQRGVVPVTEIAWLLKIAHNVCLSHWDADRRRRRLELVRDPDAIAAVASSATSDRDDLHALETALADLTDLQRRAIILREWRGLSYQEVAAELNLSSSAVETLIFRARRALVRSLECQDVSRGRTRLARALDFGGLLAGLKSAFGGGTAAKLAATGLAIGAALLPGSVPDASSRPEPEQRAPQRVAPSVPVDPATAPAARAAVEADRGRADRTRKPAADKRAPRPPKRAPGQSGPSGSPPVTETVGQAATGVTGTVNTTVTGVTETVNGTVGTVTGTVNGAVGTVTGTVNGAVGTVTGTANGTVGTVTQTVDSVPKVVAPVTDVVDGALGDEGALLP